MRGFIASGLVWALSIGAAQADDKDHFLTANILSTFYHELGHAVIDVEDLPIFGQEEDAADVFSIYMLDAVYEAEAASNLAYDTARGFRIEADIADETGEEADYSGVHGPSEQRFYNTVCIFYGGDTDTRDWFAADLGLPEERAETCEEEFDQADHSWGAVLDDMMARGAGNSLRFKGSATASHAAEVLAEEVKFLNGALTLSQPVTVVVKSCGEANAFYIPVDREIQFCKEYEGYILELAGDIYGHPETFRKGLRESKKSSN